MVLVAAKAKPGGPRPNGVAQQAPKPAVHDQRGDKGNPPQKSNESAQPGVGR